jgi:hypothetical protein
MTRTQALASTRLADQLERSFQGGAWHGPALMEVLAGVDGALAGWRPSPSSHSIGEIVGHLAYWLEDTRRQVLSEAPDSQDPVGDWAGSPTSEVTWKELLEALEVAHGRLRDAVLDLSETRLDETRSGSDTTIRGLLVGTLQHNAYHAGQISLVRKLAEGGGAHP